MYPIVLPCQFSETDLIRTYCVTEWTTSIITVTDCPDCEQVTTVPGPTVTAPVTTEVEVTYTTLCPTTETVYGPTETYLTTYTETSTILTHVPTTLYDTVPGEDVTHTEKDVVYSTLTSVYPVTKVTTLEGEEQTVTYTTTKLIETAIPTYIHETEYGEPTTVYKTDVAYSTLTSVYPVTSITTIDGVETTLTHTTTKIIETGIPTTIVKTISHPGKTVSETDVHYVTKEKTYAITQTTEISGSHVTETYQTTQTTVEEIDSELPTLYPTPTEGEEGEGKLPSASPTAGVADNGVPVALMAAVGGVLAMF